MNSLNKHFSFSQLLTYLLLLPILTIGLPALPALFLVIIVILERKDGKKSIQRDSVIILITLFISWLLHPLNIETPYFVSSFYIGSISFFIYLTYFLYHKNKSVRNQDLKQIELNLLVNDLSSKLMYCQKELLTNDLKETHSNLQQIIFRKERNLSHINVIAKIHHSIKNCFHNSSQHDYFIININPTFDNEVLINAPLFDFFLNQIFWAINSNKKFNINIEIIHTVSDSFLYIAIYDYLNGQMTDNEIDELINKTASILKQLNGNIKNKENGYFEVFLPVDIPSDHPTPTSNSLKLFILSKNNDELFKIIKKNNIEHEHFKTTLKAYKAIQRSKRNDYDLILIDNSSLKDHDPIQFSKIIKNSALENVPLLLIASTQTITNFDLIKREYLSVLDYEDISEHLVKLINISSLFSNVKVTENIPINNKTILVADDDPNTVTILKASLENLNFNVISAYDGDSALKILNTNSNIYCAILDQNMPHYDGLEIVSLYQSNAETSETTFIISSCEDYQSIEEQCLLLRNTYFLKKPIISNDIISLIENKEPIIDFLVFNRMAKNFKQNDKTIQLIVDNFENHVNSIFEKLCALDENDTKSYFKALHSIASSATNIGGIGIVKLCSEFKNQNQHTIDRKLTNEFKMRLKDIISKTVSTLKKEIN